MRVLDESSNFRTYWPFSILLWKTMLERNDHWTYGEYLARVRSIRSVSGEYQVYGLKELILYCDDVDNNFASSGVEVTSPNHNHKRHIIGAPADVIMFNDD